MHAGLAPLFGVSSAIVELVGLAPYIRDIFLKKTKPERATWWIWLVLNIIAFSAQLAAGATWSLFMTGGQILAVGLIAALSLNYGYGKFQKRDAISLLIALFGVVLWKFTNQPLLALLIVIGVDAIGYYLLVTKTWEAPHTETLITWVIAVFSSILGVLSVGGLEFTRLLYPAYIFLGDLFITFIIIYRRPRVTAKVEKR